MSVKNQIPSLCRLYLFYEKTPEELLDETDVDSFIYHKIFDISQSQHRTVRVSKGCNNKSFAVKLFNFCDLKTQQRYILLEVVNDSMRYLSSSINSLRDFLKTFDKVSKCLQIPSPKPIIDFGSTKSKDNLFSQYYGGTIEHPNRQIRLPFLFGWQQKFLRFFHQQV